MMKRLSLEDPRYVDAMLTTWTGLPVEMIVMEFYGTGDPLFEGRAEDRALGDHGTLLLHADRMAGKEPARFKRIEEAHAAAKLILNRRPGSILGVVPTWR